MTSGLSSKRSNWFSISLPPVIRTCVKSVFFAIALKYKAVYSASSRVGERIKHRAPTVVEWDPSFWTIGIQKAPVFPEPVRAIAMTLKPYKMIGMALR